MDFGEILEAWEGGAGAAPKRKGSLSGGGAGRASKRKAPEGGAGRTGAAGKGGGHGARGGAGGKKAPRVHPLTEWLRKNPVYDKDVDLDREQVPSGERRRRLLLKRADAALDLHGLSRDEAWEALEGFFKEGRRRGFEKLLIVHGKGNHSGGESVLKRTCRAFIEGCPYAGESGHAPGNSGGSGATWVILKEERGISAEPFQREDYRSR